MLSIVCMGLCVEDVLSIDCVCSVWRERGREEEEEGAINHIAAFI